MAVTTPTSPAVSFAQVSTTHIFFGSSKNLVISLNLLRFEPLVGGCQVNILYHLSSLLWEFLWESEQDIVREWLIDVLVSDEVWERKANVSVFLCCVERGIIGH